MYVITWSIDGVIFTDAFFAAEDRAAFIQELAAIGAVVVYESELGA